MKKEIEPALNVLKNHAQTDPEWAWTLHCNLAVAMQTTGVSHATSNHAALRIMWQWLGVDMEKNENYCDVMAQYKGANDEHED